MLGLCILFVVVVGSRWEIAKQIPRTVAEILWTWRRRFKMLWRTTCPKKGCRNVQCQKVHAAGASWKKLIWMELVSYLINHTLKFGELFFSGRRTAASPYCLSASKMGYGLSTVKLWSLAYSAKLGKGCLTRALLGLVRILGRHTEMLEKICWELSWNGILI